MFTIYYHHSMYIVNVINLMLHSDLMLGVVHTGGESLQDGLGNIQTYGTTLASAYVLCCLSAVWSQFQRIERSLRWE